MAKNIFTSKTFWTNVIAIGLEVAGYLPAKDAAVAIPVLNIVLRAVTTQPVKLF
jgi:hypothetical protein